MAVDAISRTEHLFFALCNAKPGEEADFDEWYNGHHVAEVIRYLPGFTGGRRYAADERQSGWKGRSPWKYLALYDLDTDDVGGMHGALPSAAQNFTRAKGLDPSHQAWVYSRHLDPSGAPSPTFAEGLILYFHNGGESVEGPDLARLAAAPFVRTVVRYRTHAQQRAEQQLPWRDLTVFTFDAAALAEIPSVLPPEDGTVRDYPDQDWAVWVYSALRPRLG